ncbi:hypothetical protein KIW84_055634 [Lathyrus oleraceus]|uniref:Uncharacterized protein n=1 Tax=Pisum sativum TaxID=3888 RepID=A0A9D4WW67_PEA|nr:hypothetical protein KIW84_055634 [Pisum sativum]
MIGPLPESHGSKTRVKVPRTKSDTSHDLASNLSGHEHRRKVASVEKSIVDTSKCKTVPSLGNSNIDILADDVEESHLSRYKEARRSSSNSCDRLFSTTKEDSASHSMSTKTDNYHSLPSKVNGAVILGSKRSTVFEVDAKAGKILRSYGAADFHNASTTAVWSGDKDRERFSTVVGANNNELADPGKLNLPEFLLQIVRTDYLFYNLWVLASLDAEGEYASDVDSGLDFAMPYACPDSKLREVYRQRKNFLFEPINFERLSDVSSYQENGMLPMPVSHLMLPSQPKSEKFLPGHNGNMMLPRPVPNSLQPEISFYDSNDNNAVVLPQPHMEIVAPRDLGEHYTSIFSCWSFATRNENSWEANKKLSLLGCLCGYLPD